MKLCQSISKCQTTFLSISFRLGRVFAFFLVAVAGSEFDRIGQDNQMKWWHSHQLLSPSADRPTDRWYFRQSDCFLFNRQIKRFHGIIAHLTIRQCDNMLWNNTITDYITICMEVSIRTSISPTSCIFLLNRKINTVGQSVMSITLPSLFFSLSKFLFLTLPWIFINSVWQSMRMKL